MRHLTAVQIVETDDIVSALPIPKNDGLTKELSYFVLVLVGFAAFLALLCVTGCGSSGPGGGYLGRTAQSAAVRMGSIEGNVREGATAASGARVYLLETSSAGAPESLLSEAVDGATPDATGSGRYGVTADALGQFKLQGSLSCTSGASVYLYAVDRAGAQMRMLGVCPATASWAGATGLTVDAATTAAMQTGGVEQAQSY